MTVEATDADEMGIHKQQISHVPTAAGFTIELMRANIPNQENTRYKIPFKNEYDTRAPDRLWDGCPMYTTVPKGQPKTDAKQVANPSTIKDSRTGYGSPASLVLTKHMRESVGAVC